MSELDKNSGLVATVTRYIKLLIEDTRLNAAEKLTQLLSAVALCSILVTIALVMLVFISLGVSMLITESLGMHWAFLIVAAVYAVLIAVIYLCRESLFVNPIARFISRLIITPPEKSQNNDDKPASIS